MKCKCGATLPDERTPDRNYCPYCGTKTDWDNWEKDGATEYRPTEEYMENLYRRD